MNKRGKSKDHFGWESEDEKLKRAMQIPPEEKLRMLYEINVFTDKVLTDKQKLIRRRLRE